MLLLILFSIGASPNESMIYIPLCFYLYEALEEECAEIEEIYIPLCFYLYSSPQHGNLIPNSFTFHYASTYTSVFDWGCRMDLLFTFHYASTYTKMAGIMQGLREKFTFHYASTYTMLKYFCIWYHAIFTFHYASTYTAYPVVIPLQCLLYLHSTMLLLIRKQNAIRWISIWNLHSTMLLLIR